MRAQTHVARLPVRAFQFWHPDCWQWIAEPGEFEILAGQSATNIVARGTVELIAKKN